jgi:hypothetical protein
MLPDEKQYYWVVICKNQRFHAKNNAFFGHTIPLAETDAYSGPPILPVSFAVRCEQCGKEYFYRPGDVMRFEMYPVEVAPHPLFQANGPRNTLEGS